MKTLSQKLNDSAEARAKWEAYLSKKTKSTFTARITKPFIKK